MRPGPRNAITDVPGIAVGNAEDRRNRSGVTVVLPDRPAVAAVDLRGGAPGTRETDLLRPDCLIERVNAVVLSGGSTFGLDAAGGVTAALASEGLGFEAGDHRIPIVPAAILFDLANGGDKHWDDDPPYRRLGVDAVSMAGPAFSLGNAGAGFGAVAGGLKGGLGSASLVAVDGTTVGALAAVNSLGGVTMADGPHFWAWPWERDAEFGGLGPPVTWVTPGFDVRETALGTSTTLVVVATDASLARGEARRLAVMAQVGLARSIRPAHTPFDGDLVFALATGDRDERRGPRELAVLGMMAADCVARAVARAVYEAETLGEVPSYKDRFSNALGGGDSGGEYGC